MFKRNQVSTAIACAVLTTSFAATANTQKDDDQTQDSVKSWGSWAKEYATAAGGELNTNVNPLAFGDASSSDIGRNSQNEAELEQAAAGACSAGSFCGFTTISYRPKEMEQEVFAVKKMKKRRRKPVQEVGVLNLEVEPTLFAEQPRRRAKKVARGMRVEGAFSVEGNDGFSLSFDGAEGYTYPSKGKLNRDSENESGKIRYKQEGNTKAGRINGDWEYDSDSSPLVVSGSFYGGITSTLEQMNQFTSKLSGGATVRYSGRTYDNAKFTIVMDFGNNTWNGNFKNTHPGIKNGFKVSGGAINGINFVADSDNLWADTVEVTGLVSGAFFGTKAQKIAGMVDVKNDFGDGVIERKTIFASNKRNIVQVQPELE